MQEDTAYSTVACGLSAAVRDPAIQALMRWIADNAHQAVGCMMEFLAQWCIGRHAKNEGLPDVTQNMLAALIPFVCNGTLSKVFGDHAAELVEQRERYLRTFASGPACVVPVSSICLHAAQLVRTALLNNVVSQFKRTVAELIRSSVKSDWGWSCADVKAVPFAVASHLLSSDADFDVGTYAPAAGTKAHRLLTAVLVDNRASLWVSTLRGVAATCRVRSADHATAAAKPVAYYVKSNPQAYLPLLMTANGLLQSRGVEAQQLFPLKKSNIPDFFRLDFFGLRTSLVRHCPYALPRTGPDACCRNTGLATTPRMEAVVWNTAFRMDRAPFLPTATKGAWAVFGKSILTDGVSVRVSRLRVDVKPLAGAGTTAAALPRLPPNAFHLNLSDACVAMSSAERQDVKADRTQRLVAEPPPLPVLGNASTASSAKRHGQAWGTRASALPMDSPEWVQCQVAVRAWKEVEVACIARRDRLSALAADPPTLSPGVEDDPQFDDDDLAAIVKGWKAKKTRAGDTAAKAWRAILTSRNRRAQARRAEEEEARPTADVPVADAQAPRKRRRAATPGPKVLLPSSHTSKTCQSAMHGKHLGPECGLSVLIRTSDR